MDSRAKGILDVMVESFTRLLGGNLVGVYLHGSLAFGCYHPGKSDIDFIAVVREPPDGGTAQSLMEAVFRQHLEAPGGGIEMSVVLLEDCLGFTHPTPYLLHFSKHHEEGYRRDPGGFCAGIRGKDPDLAAHFTVIRAVGIPLCGPPVAEVFGEVPREDYLDSIREDVAGAVEDVRGNPVYVILNLCRVLAAGEEGLVLSKVQGGAWALERIDGAYRGLVQGALDSYGVGTDLAPDPGEAAAFCAYMLERIG